MREEIRVLIVNDDPEVGELTATFLERADGQFVAEAATGPEEGFEHLRSTTADCVVSDYGMPGTDGIEFLESVREEHPDLPFVLFTGKGSESVASDAISAGATDYLQRQSGAEQYELLANRVRNAVEQHRSRIELAETSEEYAAVFENVRSGLLLVDVEAEGFRYRRCNPQVLDDTGLREHELVGRTPREAFGRESGRKVVGAYRACLERGASLSYTAEFDFPAGRAIQECEVTPVSTSGEIEQLVVTCRDVTDQREREAELRRTAARLGALFENSPDMINVHDTEGTILDPNPQLCAETGYEESELAGMKVWELDVGMDRGSVADIWAEMAPGDRHRISSEFRRKDGSTFPVEIHIRRLDLAGESRFLVISRNVTDRREREAELKRYERIVTTMQEAACIYDEEGRFEVVNEYLAGFYDTTPEALVGQESNLIPKIEAESDGDPYRELLDGERDEIRGEIHDEFPGRGEEVLAYRLTPLVIDGGIEGAVAVAHEVTDHRQREAALEQKNRQLEEFASVVSHDLRNPLNVARGRLELLDTDGSEHVEAIDRSLARMESIIDDVLTLALKGDTLDEVGSVALGELAAGCWRTVETGPATLEIDTDRTVQGDRDQLRHLFENLYRNSVEHSSTGSRTESGDAVEHGSKGSRSRPHENSVGHGSTDNRAESGDSVERSSTGSRTGSDDPEVTVTVGVLDDGTGFYVEDDGAGIPPERRDTVFEAGYSTADEGTGFGLRIVEQIATAHGWDVTVTAGTDGGARFEFTGVEFDAVGE